MLYRRLTKEEFDNMSEDFSIFLASNSIDKAEWDEIKANDTEKADGMLDIFSDLVFEKALSSCKYLERISETEIHTYFFAEKQAHMITIQVKEGVSADFVHDKLSEIFIQLLKDKNLNVLQGTKAYEKKREVEMFEIMQKGAQFSKGELYRSLLTLL